MNKTLVTNINNDNNSKLFISKMIENALEEDKNTIQDNEKQFVYDEIVTVGKQPKTFYYNYDNDQYYFTAKNAKFEININGEIVWYYGEWIDGFFRNGLWIDGVWHNGTFCRGNWLDGKWENGQWYEGQIDGSKSKKHP